MKNYITALIFLTSFSLAAQPLNFRAEGGNTSYVNKELCEKQEQAPCYGVNPREAAIKSIKEVEVDDPTKPIIEETEPDIVEVEPIEDKCPDGSKPKKDKEKEGEIELPVERLVCERLACEAPFELDNDTCRRVVGYEKKLEKRFVVDPDKVAAKEAAEQAMANRIAQCEQSRALLEDSAINEQSRPSDVQEVVKRLLSFHKNCR